MIPWFMGRKFNGWHPSGQSWATVGLGSGLGLVAAIAAFFAFFLSTVGMLPVIIKVAPSTNNWGDEAEHLMIILGKVLVSRAAAGFHSSARRESRGKLAILNTGASLGK